MGFTGGVKETTESFSRVWVQSWICCTCPSRTGRLKGILDVCNRLCPTCSTIRTLSSSLTWNECSGNRPFFDLRPRENYPKSHLAFLIPGWNILHFLVIHQLVGVHPSAAWSPLAAVNTVRNPGEIPVPSMLLYSVRSAAPSGWQLQQAG